MEGNLIPNLFRTEFSKIAAVLCRHLGVDHIEAAEDIASDTFLSAMEIWPYKGVPDNPVAWLYAVAKNKTKNYLRRNQIFATQVAPEQTRHGPEEPDMSENNIADSQLQMLFAICHPSIPPESQIGLALRILCGFGIDEIATAFLTNRETINKRLFRAREKLRQEKISLELPDNTAIGDRLERVLRTLYLLFSEGYYSESNASILRKELCTEAMRLVKLLIENEMTNLPHVNALFALMCFHASRLDARAVGDGGLVLYDEQDELLWDRTLISKGAYHLHRASTGSVLSKYHVEAAIAYWHTQKSQEKWESILSLYDTLLDIDPSPVIKLNRVFALSKVKGAKTAVAEAERLALSDNQYYHLLLGELYKELDPQKSLAHLRSALSLATTGAEKASIEKKYFGGKLS